MLTTNDGACILSPVTSADAIPYCETWGDHDWGGARLVEIGRHPRRGGYQVYAVSCAKCPKVVKETRWSDLLSVTGALTPP